MHVMKQVFAITRMNLQSVPLRPGTSLVVVIGIAGVVGVLVSVLAMVTGLAQVMTSSGRPDRAIVLGTGSSFEILSNLSREATRTILDAPEVRRGSDAKPVASAEALAIVRTVLNDGNSANLPLRGVGPAIFALRPELRIVEGRAFDPAVRELMVGRSAQRQFRGMQVGSRINLRGSEWTVVGVFESSGDQHEAELITGVETLQSAFRRNAFQSVTVQLESAESFPSFKAALTNDPSLSVDVLRESDYDQQQSKSLTQVLAAVAYLVGGIMALGAAFGAVNSMYTAVSGRAVEIATLRVLGFGPASIAVSVFAEALLLALAGGVVGACMAWLIFNGHVISTNGAGVNQLAVPLIVGPRIVALGILWACVIGMIGACFPAIHAARAPLAAALRGN